MADERNPNDQPPTIDTFTLLFDRQDARYVKRIFPVNVYILSDELQVYGCETLSTAASDLTSQTKSDLLEKYVGHFADGICAGDDRRG